MMAVSCSIQPNKALGKIRAGDKLGGEILHYVMPVPSWAKRQKITGEFGFRARIADDRSVKEHPTERAERINFVRGGGCEAVALSAGYPEQHSGCICHADSD